MVILLIADQNTKRESGRKVQVGNVAAAKVKHATQTKILECSYLVIKPDCFSDHCFCINLSEATEIRFTRTNIRVCLNRSISYFTRIQTIPVADFCSMCNKPIQIVIQQSCGATKCQRIYTCTYPVEL